MLSVHPRGHPSRQVDLTPRDLAFHEVCHAFVMLHRHGLKARSRADEQFAGSQRQKALRHVSKGPERGKEFASLQSQSGGAQVALHLAGNE
jgi:hypothetical protein